MKIMKYYVLAETTSFFTLPPGKKFIKTGDVEIRLIDRSQESEKSFVEVMDVFGAEKTNAVQKAPVKLEIRTTVEATSNEEAFKLGKIKIEAAMDIISLASGAAISPAFLSGISWYSSKTELKLTKPVLLTHREVYLWNDKCEDLAEHLPSGLDKLPEKDRERLMNALRWRRKAAAQEDIVIQFLFFWFSIEALAQMTFVNVKPTAEQCSNCQKPIVCSTCGHGKLIESTSRRTRRCWKKQLISGVKKSAKRDTG